MSGAIGLEDERMETKLHSSRVSYSSSTDSSMDLLWCGAKNRKKDKTDVLKEPGKRGEWFTKGSESIPEVNIDLTGMESLSVTITRGRNGFGFTVFGSSPVQVGRVDESSPAFKAGLRKYDCIVRINGKNVSRSMAESVARIVRESETVIRLEVQRTMYCASSDTSSTVSLATFDKPRRPSETTLLHDTSYGSQRPNSLLVTTPNHPYQRRPFAPLPANGQPSIVVPPKWKGQHDLDRSSVCSVDYDQMPLPSSSTPSCSAEISRLSAWHWNLIPTEDTLQRRSSRTVTPSKPKKPPMPLPSQPELRNDKQAPSPPGKEGLRTTEASPLTDDKKMSECDQNNVGDRWPYVHKLINCEEDFVLQMQLGMQRYLQPLRQTYLSSEEHSTVFQNLEEILSRSEFHLRELHSQRVWHSYEQSADVELETEEDGRHDDSTAAAAAASASAVGTTESRIGKLSTAAVASIYVTQIDTFCSAYETYCPGVMNSLHFLASLKRSNQDLQMFLKKEGHDCDQFTISAFLQKPIEHMKELVLAIQKILCYTQTTSSEYKSLKQVVHALRNSCSSINVNHVQRCSSSLSSSVSSNESVPMRSFSSSSSSDSPAASVVSSIDTEVLEIQSKLVFPENVRSFHLATASHHMIYSGRLSLIDGCTSIPLFMALLSDLILLTRTDPDLESLYVLEEPILLHDVVGCNFNCSHPLEFVLSIETSMTSLSETWKPRSLVFVTPSVDLKCTWKNILEQRIATCKAQREVNISKRKADKFV